MQWSPNARNYRQQKEQCHDDDACHIRCADFSIAGFASRGDGFVGPARGATAAQRPEAALLAEELVAVARGGGAASVASNDPAAAAAVNIVALGALAWGFLKKQLVSHPKKV